MPNPRKCTDREAILLMRLCAQRIRHLERCIKMAAGDLYPSIWAKEIGEIEGLYENLTGRPWKEADHASPH